MTNSSGPNSGLPFPDRPFSALTKESNGQDGGNMQSATRVYVSATYRDLHVQRRAVTTVLRRTGHQHGGVIVSQERLARANGTISQYDDPFARAGSWLADLPSEIIDQATIREEQINLAGGQHRNATFATNRELECRLSSPPIAPTIDWDSSDNAALHDRRVFAWAARFVPVIEGGRFTLAVDQQVLIEHVARLFMREQVARPVDEPQGVFATPVLGPGSRCDHSQGERRPPNVKREFAMWRKLDAYRQEPA